MENLDKILRENGIMGNNQVDEIDDKLNAVKELLLPNNLILTMELEKLSQDNNICRLYRHYSSYNPAILLNLVYMGCMSLLRELNEEDVEEVLMEIMKDLNLIGGDQDDKV